jgi:hypothetical protein
MKPLSRIALAHSWHYLSRWALKGHWREYGIRTGPYRRFRHFASGWPPE